MRLNESFVFEVITDILLHVYISTFLRTSLVLNPGFRFILFIILYFPSTRKLVKSDRGRYLLFIKISQNTFCSENVLVHNYDVNHNVFDELLFS